MSRIASSPLVAAALTLDQTSSEPLYQQLYQKLRDAILAGRIAPGIQIPSSRELAHELGVARNTVLNAISQLVAEGYLQSEHGSGSYVNRTLPDDFVDVARTARTTRRRHQQHAPAPVRGLRFASAFPPLTAGIPKPFHPAVPAVEDFPFALWLRLLQKQWRRHPSDLLGFGDPAGYLPLRRALAAYLTTARAVSCDAEQIVIVSGAQQALDLASRVLIAPGDAVWIEDPAYPGASAVLSASGARLVPVPVDDEGLDVQTGIMRQKDACLAYVTPSHQFPLGMTMSLTRRLELVNWAQQTGAWILEDDYDSEYRYTSRPLAALQGLAPVGRVFYVGTFSKVLFPSLRLGYLVAPAALVDTLIAARTVMSGQAPLIEQAVLAEFMSEGHFGRHLRRMRALYEERQLTLLSEVRRELAGLLDVYPADAGMHTIGWLPRGVRDRRAAALAAMHGVETLPVSTFYKGSCPRGGLMLGFAAFRASELRKGVQKLARALRSLKGSPTEITTDHISR